MSDTTSDTEPQPLTPDETRQVLAGWNLWIKQPTMAPRFFAKFMEAVNTLLGLRLPSRVADLEKRIAALEAAQKPAAKPEQKSGQKSEKLDNV